MFPQTVIWRASLDRLTLNCRPLRGTRPNSVPVFRSLFVEVGIVRWRIASNRRSATVPVRPTEFIVALCVKTQSNDPSDLQTGIARVFKEMFRTEEHLEVILLSDQQESGLQLIAAPFYSCPY